MLRKVWEIVIRREHLGYLLGALTAMACYELRDTQWLTLVIVAVSLFGFDAVRKWGK